MASPTIMSSEQDPAYKRYVVDPNPPQGVVGSDFLIHSKHTYGVVTCNAKHAYGGDSPYSLEEREDEDIIQSTNQSDTCVHCGKTDGYCPDDSFTKCKCDEYYGCVKDDIMMTEEEFIEHIKHMEKRDLNRTSNDHDHSESEEVLPTEATSNCRAVVQPMASSHSHRHAYDRFYPNCVRVVEQVRNAWFCPKCGEKQKPASNFSTCCRQEL